MQIAILSDIHGNLEALDEVLHDMGAVDTIWCLGDLVGYGPDPAACIRRAREGKFICVAGNHDLAAAGEMDSSEAFNIEADTAVQWTAQQLNMADRAFLASLPTEEQHGDFTLVHGSPLDPDLGVSDQRAAGAAELCVLCEPLLSGGAHPRTARFSATLVRGTRSGLRDHRAAAR